MMNSNYIAAQKYGVSEFSIRYWRAQIKELEAQSKQTEHLTKELQCKCGKDGIEHIYGDWKELNSANGQITVYRTSIGMNYRLETDREWCKTCKWFL